jgi:hypothetical protein
MMMVKDILALQGRIQQKNLNHNLVFGQAACLKIKIKTF